MQWQRYWGGAQCPELVKTVAQIAFEVSDLESEIEGKNVIIPPSAPGPGVKVAFIEVNGAPFELMELTKQPHK